MPQSNSVADRRTANRWMQLIAGIVCMVMIANLQYGWTLFVHPIREKFGWDRSAVQVAFTIFILVETWVVPFEGWFVDRFGPKLVVLLGGVLVGLAWSLNSIADLLALLYLGAALGGVGAGGVFGTCIGNALKWFPDRRGLAAGLTAAGYGFGSAFTIIPIQSTIQADGYQAAFLWFGIGQGVIVCLASLMLVAPHRRGAGGPAPPADVEARLHAPGDAALAAVLAAVRHVRAGERRRLDLHGPARARRARLRRRRRAGEPDGHHPAGAHLRAHHRPHNQRRDATVLRLGVRPYRTRDHHVHRFFAGSRRYLGAGPLGPRSPDVRAVGRRGLLRLGRGREPLPGNLHRLFRGQVRHRQFRPALHRQGHRLAAGAAGQPARRRDRPLACGVRDRCDHERCGGPLAIAVLRPMRSSLLARASPLREPVSRPWGAA